MSRGIKETAVSFFKRGGHDHNGKNSTKIDFSNYTVSDINILAKLLGDPGIQESSGTADAAEVIESGGVGTQVANTFVQDKIDPPKSIRLATGKVMYGHERTYVDASWEAPPVRDFYYDEYYFNYYYPHDFGYSVKEYAVSIVKEGVPDSDHRTITKNTNIRFWDVDPGIDYRLYVWAINPLGNESLYITDTIVSEEINRTLVAEKNRSILENGGFEDGFLNWQVGGTGTWSIESTIVYEGAQSIKCTMDAFETGQLVSPLVPVTPDLSYDMSYYTRSSSALTTQHATVWFYDENVDDLEFHDLGQYEGLTPGGAAADEFNRLPRDIGFPKAPLEAAYVQLSITISSDAAGDITYIDNIRIEETSTLEGAIFRTDADDQTPRIEIDDHYNIRGPRERSLAEYGPRLTFNETFSEINDGHQEIIEVKSGLPVVAGTEYEDLLVGEGRLQVISSPSDPSGLDGQGRMEMRFVEDYNFGEFQKIYSLPLGIVGYAETASTFTTTAGSAEVILTCANDVVTYSDRVYRWTFNPGYMQATNTGDIFEIKFQLDGTNRIVQRFTVTALHSKTGTWGGTWSSTVDLTGVARVIVQRLSGSGTININPDPRTFFSLEDIGSQFIHDLNP